MTSPKPEDVLCGGPSERQHVLLVRTAGTQYAVRALSAPGLTLMGFFFAPVIPDYPSSSQGNILFVYSQKQFSTVEKDFLKTWQMKSDEGTAFPVSIDFLEGAGSFGGFPYSWQAKLLFERSTWAKDFDLIVKDLNQSQTIKFLGDSHWSYQWMGNEQRQPKCLPR